MIHSADVYFIQRQITKTEVLLSHTLLWAKKKARKIFVNEH